MAPLVAMILDRRFDEPKGVAMGRPSWAVIQRTRMSHTTRYEELALFYDEGRANGFAGLFADSDIMAVPIYDEGGE